MVVYHQRQSSCSGDRQDLARSTAKGPGIIQAWEGEIRTIGRGSDKRVHFRVQDSEVQHYTSGRPARKHSRRRDTILARVAEEQEKFDELLGAESVLTGVK